VGERGRAAGTTDVDAVRTAMYGQKFPNLTGGEAEMLPNHHLTKPVLIGEIQEDGQFDIISQTEPVPGDAWTDFLPESRAEVGLEGTRLRNVQHRDQDLRAAQFKLLILRPLPPSQLVLVVPCFASSSSFLPL
jgi:hypothetical protein